MLSPAIWGEDRGRNGAANLGQHPMGISSVWPQIKFAAGPLGIGDWEETRNEKDEQHEKIHHDKVESFGRSNLSVCYTVSGRIDGYRMRRGPIPREHR